MDDPVAGKNSNLKVELELGLVLLTNYLRNFVQIGKTKLAWFQIHWHLVHVGRYEKIVVVDLLQRCPQD